MNRKTVTLMRRLCNFGDAYSRIARLDGASFVWCGNRKCRVGERLTDSEVDQLVSESKQFTVVITSDPVNPV